MEPARLAGTAVLRTQTDERLVDLVRHGNDRAFEAIVHRYRAPLLRYCSGFVSGAAAEDAVQQTFINAYAALSRDDDSRVPTALRPWLYRIAHNAALNVAREPQAGLEELPEGLDGVERPDEVVAARERFRRVIGAVSALPPKQRQVIVRHAVDGDSHERIATDLGMTAGSIRQLAHRARRTVREAAAALLPGPLLRVLPFGPDAAEVLPAAGGGAVVANHDTAKPATAKSHVHPAPLRTPVATPPAKAAAPSPAGGGFPSGTSGSTRGGDGSGSSKHGSSGSGKSGSSDSSGSGSSGSGSSGSGSDSSGSGSSGSGSSGSGSSGSGTSGSGTSGSSTSGSGTSGSGTSGSGTSGSGTSGSGTSGSGTSGSGISGSGSSGSGSSGSGSDSSGSGSSGSGSGSSESSGKGSSDSGD